MTLYTVISARLSSLWSRCSARLMPLREFLYAVAFTVGLMAGVMFLAWVIPAKAMEQTPDGFKLSPTELARCQIGGGCILIPMAEFEIELAKWIKKAFDAGRIEGCRGT